MDDWMGSNLQGTHIPTENARYCDDIFCTQNKIHLKIRTDSLAEKERRIQQISG